MVCESRRATMAMAANNPDEARAVSTALRVESDWLSMCSLITSVRLSVRIYQSPSVQGTLRSNVGTRENGLRRAGRVSEGVSGSDQRDAVCVGGLCERARLAMRGALTPLRHAFRLPRTPPTRPASRQPALRAARNFPTGSC